MKAIVHEQIVGIEGLTVKEMEEPRLGEKEVKVKVHTAGLNRRDLAVITKRHQPEDPALIPGSDAAGTVMEVGDKVSRFQIGDEVVVNPGLGWKKNSSAPPEGFEIVGLPDHGTFAQFYTSDENHFEAKPSHLSFEEAGVLSLAALTAYRALFTRGNLQKDQTVMLPGIGSGVLTFALKYAKAIGARVIVTSRSEDKLQQALALGADRAIHTEDGWNEALHDESIDLLIESIGKATFDKSLNIIRKGGTIVTFGATTEDQIQIDIRKFFYGQYNLLGSTMGSAEELREMLQFIEKHNIKPQLDRVYSLDEYKNAFEYLRDTKNFGKIGISFKLD
ncbi:zinc-dependent alcohol dehydrogenase family protein [Halobacillus halophilus]|uniref:zinc-dependent alcohol dehydrogenase family protein n=1 Tax=Halobacillus halophilus TaxID=1570 RepID=UPI001CD3FEA7|nr:NAD(P)-dependent alcohol dehydrogenase [Halobacillus halophilus]MCA1009376.1 NAD(P)-dependent alcohol dehydrogenase [Halobacillus halophilus]